MLRRTRPSCVSYTSDFSPTTHKYIDDVDNKNWPQFYKRLWQRNYYEHVIRDEKDLDRIRDYVQANPDNWDEDKENPIYKNRDV